MGIYITKDKHGAIQDKISTLLKTGKIGDAISLYTGFGYNYLSFHCIKIGSKTINVYGIGYGYSRVVNRTPVIKITKDSFNFIEAEITNYNSNTTKSPGTWSFVIRGFLSMGVIPNIEIRYLRHGTLVKCNGTEVATHFPMKLDWNGNLLSRIPKKVRLFTEKCHNDNKRIINASARSNYANTRVVRLVREAKNTGDWDKIKPLDVFSLTNVARRTDLIEHFGMDTILDSIDHTIVDKNEIDGRKYELLRFELPINNGLRATTPATYLKMINPSTGETCVEGVPNNRYHDWGREINMNTVEQALAWRDGDSESYLVPVALT